MGWSFLVAPMKLRGRGGKGLTECGMYLSPCLYPLQLRDSGVSPALLCCPWYSGHHFCHSWFLDTSVSTEREGGCCLGLPPWRECGVVGMNMSMGNRWWW